MSSLKYLVSCTFKRSACFFAPALQADAFNNDKSKKQWSVVRRITVVMYRRSLVINNEETEKPVEWRKRETKILIPRGTWRTESIELFIENQASLRSYDLAHPPPLFPSASCLAFSVFLCIAGRAYWRERGGRGWARSHIIRPREKPGHL
jgi:hypothetical protein